MNKKHFYLTGLFSFLFFGFVFRLTVFMWISGFIIIFLFQITTSLLPFASLLYDRQYKTKTIYHSLIILIVFWTCYFGQQIITDQFEKSTEAKAEVLISKIEKYKAINGNYPTSLNSKEFDNFDFATAMGSELIYTTLSDSTFGLKYSAFHGGTKYYHRESKGWGWDD